MLHPVADVAAAVDFYATAFGLPTRFVDGDRYAALDGNGTTLALAAPEEDITGGVPAASFKVADVAATLAALEQAGGRSSARRSSVRTRCAPSLAIRGATRWGVRVRVAQVPPGRTGPTQPGQGASTSRLPGPLG